jgi:hypothetical protein
MRILGKRMGYYSKQVIKGGTVEGTGDNLRTVINKANVKTPDGEPTITEREGLSAKMRAAEKASKTAYEVAKKEVTERLSAEFKEKNVSAENVRKWIVAYAQVALPPELRGRYNLVIAKASNVEQMVKAFRKIDKLADAWQRRGIWKQTVKLAQLAQESPSIAVENRQAIRAMMEQAAPEWKGWITAKLIDLRNAVMMERGLGKATIALEKQAHLERVESAVSEMVADKRIRSYDSPKEEGGSLDDDPTMRQRFKSRWDKVRGTFTKAGKAITNIDVMADWMDGYQDYTGPMHRRMVDDFNRDYYVFKDSFDRIGETWLKNSIEKHKLNWKGSGRRLLVFMAMRQGTQGESAIRGTMREKWGMNDAQIEAETAKYSDPRNLSVGERAFVEDWDNYTKQAAPRIARLMRKLYNKEFVPVENYAPLSREYTGEPNVMESLEADLTRGTLTEERGGVSAKNVDHKFTIERENANEKPLRYDNFFDSAFDHLKRAEYFLATADTLRTLHDIVEHPDFREVAGDLGKKFWQRHVNTLVHMGGGNGQRVKWLDLLARNFGRARLLYRPVTAAVQLGAMIPSMRELGTTRVMDAAWKLATDEGTRKWMSENAKVVKYRNYNDPFMQALVKDPFTSHGALDRLSGWGGKPMQALDKISAAATWLAAYQAELEKRGITYESAATMPIVREAVDKADVVTRTTQGSHEFKDVPQALSAGTLTGNASVDRALLQFQNYPLTQWASLNHAVKQALAFNKPQIAAKYVTWMLLATAVEAAIRMGYWEAIAKLSGKDDDDDARRKYFETFIKNTVQNVPFGGHVDMFANAASDQISELVFDRKGKPRPIASESPLFPAESSLIDLKRGARMMLNSKTPQAKAKGAILAGTSVGGAFGAPGMSTLADAFRMTIPAKEKRGDNPYRTGSANPYR